jgi:hypothetical protein
MKKIIICLVVFAIPITINTLSSCNNVKEEIINVLPPFTYTQTGIAFDIPPVPIVVPEPIPTPEQIISININQLIKDNAGINYNINNISSIKIKNVSLHLTNPDANNNWTNFESAELFFNTEKGISENKPWISGSLFIPDVDSVRFTDKVVTISDVNLKTYLYGDADVIHYKALIKNRKTTSTTLHTEVSIKFEFKF